MKLNGGGIPTSEHPVFQDLTFGGLRECFSHHHQSKKRNKTTYADTYTHLCVTPTGEEVDGYVLVSLSYKNVNAKVTKEELDENECHGHTCLRPRSQEW